MPLGCPDGALDITMGREPALRMPGRCFGHVHGQRARMPLRQPDGALETVETVDVDTDGALMTVDVDMIPTSTPNISTVNSCICANVLYCIVIIIVITLYAKRMWSDIALIHTQRHT